MFTPASSFPTRINNYYVLIKIVIVNFIIPVSNKFVQDVVMLVMTNKLLWFFFPGHHFTKSGSLASIWALPAVQHWITKLLPSVFVLNCWKCQFPHIAETRDFLVCSFIMYSVMYSCLLYSISLSVSLDLTQFIIVAPMFWYHLADYLVLLLLLLLLLLSIWASVVA